MQKVADPDPDNDAPAHTLVQVGNEMFVGGKFAAVQNGAGGAQYNQPWLAAFDVQTGNWISTFRPKLDGEVFSLAAAPNGDLIVAGDFTNVNGSPHTSGLAEIDPTTGQVVSSFTAYVTSPRFGAVRPYVRTVAVAGNWLYVGGGFNRLIGGPTLFTVVPEGLGRVRLSDGTPDRTWKVATDLPVVDVYPSQDGTRVYAAGFFHNVDNTPGIDGVAVLDATSGALVPGMNRPQFDQGNQHRWYQYTILEDGNYVYIGGGKHELQEYTRSSFSWVTGHVEQWHGDFQVAQVYNGVIIAGCHCDVYDYSSTDSYPTPTNYSQVAPASWLMAFSPNGLTNLTDFAPQIGMSSAGEGIWGITLDSYGCVWAAGDIVRGRGGNRLARRFRPLLLPRHHSADHAHERQGGGHHPVVEPLHRQLRCGAPVRGDPQRPRDCHHHSAESDRAGCRPLLRPCDRRRREPLGVHNRDQRLVRERSRWEQRHLPCNDHAGPTGPAWSVCSRRSLCVTLWPRAARRRHSEAGVERRLDRGASRRAPTAPARGCDRGARGALGLGHRRARRRGVGPGLAHTRSRRSRRAGGLFDRGHERRDGRRPAHAGGVRTRRAGRQPRRRQGHAGG